jgi:hypothetical protein
MPDHWLATYQRYMQRLMAVDQGQHSFDQIIPALIA